MSFDVRCKGFDTYLVCLEDDFLTLITLLDTLLLHHDVDESLLFKLFLTHLSESHLLLDLLLVTVSSIEEFTSLLGGDVSEFLRTLLLVS